MIHDAQSAQISQKQDGHNIYVIMKTVYPPGHHHNVFVAIQALGCIADTSAPKSTQQDNPLHSSRLLNKHILHPSCFCEIWALCVVSHLWPLLLHSFIEHSSPIFNHTSCAQEDALQQSQCDNQEGTLFLRLHICYAHLVSGRF